MAEMIVVLFGDEEYILRNISISRLSRRAMGSLQIIKIPENSPDAAEALKEVLELMPLELIKPPEIPEHIFAFPKQPWQKQKKQTFNAQPKKCQRMERKSR